jgi:hypothetical protein
MSHLSAEGQTFEAQNDLVNHMVHDEAVGASAASY